MKKAWRKLWRSWTFKPFQNLLEIYSVVSRELTTLWLRNLDINYKRSQNIGWNEHKSWPIFFAELTTKHSMDWARNMRNNIWEYCMGVEKNNIVFASHEQPTFRDATGIGRLVKWRVCCRMSAELNSILMTCHHPDLGDKQKFMSSAEDWYWLQIVFCQIFLWGGLLGAVRLPARPHCRYNKQKQVLTKSSAKTPKTQQPSEWCQPLGLAESN